MIFRDLAIQNSYTFEREANAQRFLESNGQITLHQADENMLRGSAQATTDYQFQIDFAALANSRCTCGAYLASHNNGTANYTKLCTHQIAGVIAADNGAPIVAKAEVNRQPRQPGTPRSASTTVTQSTPAQSQAFRAKLERDINRAVIHRIVDPILAEWAVGRIPLLIGQPGLGKTVGAGMTVEVIGFDRFVTEEGTQSKTDADLVGFKKDNENKVPGFIAEGFGLARAGHKVVMLMDEVGRLNKRSLDTFLPAFTPISAESARRQGIDTDESVYIVKAPLWGTEWAPCSRIRWVLGSNPQNMNNIEDAFLDRVSPLKVDYDPNVLKHFDDKIKNAILKIWEMGANGTVTLPITYRGISQARNGSDKSIFDLYLRKISCKNLQAYSTILDYLVSIGLMDAPANAAANMADDLTV